MSKKKEFHEATEKEHWADNIAKKIVADKGELEEYTVAAGITPSGVVHIGNFREIITVDLIAKALRKIGKKVRFIYSWDDYDVFRKIPANFPNKEVLEKYLCQPIVDVPDPFEKHTSFAEHNEKEVEEQLPNLGIFPEFLYQAKKYRAREYSEGIKTAILNRKKIKELLDAWRKEPLAEEWSPVRVFCEKCNTDKTKILDYPSEYELKYSCECGFEDTFDFRKKGIAKLQWRVDWPMRWSFEKVQFEPSGKEHSSDGGSNTTASEISKQIWEYSAPYHIMYEFISIKGTGGKMSSSKGNTIDLNEMLSIYEPSIIRNLFVRTIPSKSFEISFDSDVISIYDSFDKLERSYFGEEEINENLKTSVAIAERECDGINITTTEEMQEATDFVLGIKTLTKSVKAEKEKITKPLNESLKGVRALFKPFEEKLKYVLDTTNNKIVDFSNKLEEEMSVDEEVKITNIKSAHGTMTFRKVKDIEIVDVNIIPRAYMVPDMVLIRKHVVAGAKIDGVILVEKKIPSLRA